MSSKKAGIYLITNNINGKIYVGSTNDIANRWSCHITRTSQLIGKAIKKYGDNNFTCEIIEHVDNPSKDVLEEREQYYLDLYQPFPWNDNKGYNIAEKAYTCYGVKRSEETRKKMSEAWVERKKSDSYPEYLQYLSERVSGDKNPAKRLDVRKKISNSAMGNTWADDEKRVEEHSNRMKKTSIFNCSDFQETNRQKHIGSKRTEESKARMSEWQQRKYLLVSSDGEERTIYSKELKQFCDDHELGYPNLIRTVKTEKFYKKKWKLVFLE